MGFFGAIGKGLKALTPGLGGGLNPVKNLQGAGKALGGVPGMGAVGSAVGAAPGMGAALGAGAAVGGALGGKFKPRGPTTIGQPLGPLSGPQTIGQPLGPISGPGGLAPGSLGKALGGAAPGIARPNLAAKPITSADAGALGSDTDLAKPAVMARKTFSARGFRGGRR